MKLPLVTAIIPVHNHEKWANDAIASVIKNHYQNKRIVVVDDGSTDKSLSNIFKLVRNAHKIDLPKNNDEPKSIHKGSISFDKSITDIIVVSFNRAYGPSFARNYGIRTAWEGTDLFAFLDSDDLYEEQKIAQSVIAWQKQPQLIGVVYSDYSTFGADGILHRQFKEPFSINRLMQECIINCDSLVSKLALEKCGLFDESMRVCEDYKLWCILSKKFMSVHIPQSLVKIRVGEHSATSQVSKSIWQECYNKVMNEFRNG